MAEQNGATGRDGRSSDAELARRLDRLSRDLDREKRERAAGETLPKSDSTNIALAFRLASEFVAGVLVGAALGWGFDHLAGTSPWGLIVLLLLGFCAGVVNVVRAAGGMTGKPGSGASE